MPNCPTSIRSRKETVETTSERIQRTSWVRGGSRISGKGVHMYKGVGVRFADFISFFSNIPWKWNNLVSLRPNYFTFIGYLKRGLGWRGSNDPPWTSSGFATERVEFVGTNGHFLPTPDWGWEVVHYMYKQNHVKDYRLPRNSLAWPDMTETMLTGPELPGRVAQLVTCLTADMCLIADQGVASSIPAQSHIC